MLRDDPAYARAVGEAFAQAEYDPVADCTNYLFHRHTAELPPAFRPSARDLLTELTANPAATPIILTNSLGDKVNRLLGTLGLEHHVAVLGDTRQYAMDPSWPRQFHHPKFGQIQHWLLSELRQIDLRRPIYYHALVDAASDGSRLAVVADTLSLPGAMPLIMGIPFFLLRTPYTPDWCVQTVDDHPMGTVLDDLDELPAALKP
jgi:hypothetical protein